MSDSATHRLPLHASSMSTWSASCAERLGRNPNEHSSMSASKIGSMTIFAAACTTRSRTAGTVASNCTSCSGDFGWGLDVGGVRDAFAAGLLDLGWERDAVPVGGAAVGVELTVGDPVVDDAG